MSIETDFPAAAELTYLNAASVALMPRSASDYAEAWQRDIAENGTQNFDEVAEDRVFDEVRAAIAKLIGATATDIAVASSASEFVAGLGPGAIGAADHDPHGKSSTEGNSGWSVSSPVYRAVAANGAV